MIQLPFTSPEIAGDGQDQYLLGDGAYRLTFVHGTELINRARANHQLNPAGAILLGQAYLLALMAASTMKNEERIGLLVECDGEVDGISVEATAQGQVRGYLKESEIELALIDDYDRLFGSGTLTLLRYAEDMRHPARGQVELRSGNLSENVAWYYAHSEQTATLLDVNIHFDDTQRIAGAAGVLVQALPGGDPAVLDQIAEKLDAIRPFGEHFASGATAVQLVREALAPWNPKLISTRPAEFYCGCSKERFGRFLSALPEDEREDILENGPIPLHTTCHNCNSTYAFSRDELSLLLRLYR